jgi:hypothetical protein
VARLEQAGSCETVAAFDGMQLLHVEHRDRLREELGIEPARPSWQERWK